MGADQEGARVITTQSKAEENHYELYHRWAIDCTVQSAQLFILGQSVCVLRGDALQPFVSLHVPIVQVCLGSHAFKCDTRGQPHCGSPADDRQNTVFPL